MDAVTLTLARGQKYRLDRKHRALVIFDQAESDYAVTIPTQLAAQGFGVEVTSWLQFTRHHQDWVHEFDLLVLADARKIAPYQPVTAQEVHDAIAAWQAAGKATMLLWSYGFLTLAKSASNGAAEATADLTTIFPVNVYSRSFDGSGSWELTDEYPLAEDMRLGSFVPNGSVRHITGADITVLVRGEQNGTTSNTVVGKQGDFAILGYGGFVGGIDDGSYYRYLDGGLLAKWLIGDETRVKLAPDLIGGKRVAASGVDCDVTDEPAANQALIDAYDAHGVELGLLADRLTPALAGYYRSRNRDAQLVSHSSDHMAATTVTDELHTIPASGIVTLDYPYRVDSVTVATQDDAVTFSHTPATRSSGEYYLDEIGNLHFDSADVGLDIKVTYDHIDEVGEWIGSLATLRGLGCLTNPAIYLTGHEHSMRSVTVAQLLADGVTLCDHIGIERMFVLLADGVLPKLPPLVNPTFVLAEGTSAFDGVVWDTTKADAKATVWPSVLARVRERRLPLVWYTHDFIFSETDSRSLHQGGFDADWTQGTYAETVAYAQEFLTWLLDQLGSEGFRIMHRSDYSRFFDRIMRDVRYDILSNGEIVVMNEGRDTIRGVTFREARDSAPNRVLARPDTELEFEHADGELLFSLDLLPGEAVRVRVQ